MFQNVVVGTPNIEPSRLFGFDDKDWDENEKDLTLFTETRFLPAIMKEAKIVSSTSEVRRNRPELFRNLEKEDFICIKWGKKQLWILVGR